MSDVSSISSRTVRPPEVEAPRDQALWTAAKALEASFLATMLQSAGLGEARESFGGGVGEEQFSGLLAAEQASTLTEAGGVGLAESIYRSLAKAEDGQ